MSVLVSALVYVGTAVFLITLFVGVLATLVGLPGTVLILLDTVIFSACHGFQRPHWWFLLILLVVSILAETSDNLLSAVGVKAGGGSTRTSLWALIGGGWSGVWCATPPAGVCCNWWLLSQLHL